MKIGSIAEEVYLATVIICQKFSFSSFFTVTRRTAQWLWVPYIPLNMWAASSSAHLYVLVDSQLSFGGSTCSRGRVNHGALPRFFNSSPITKVGLMEWIRL